MSASADRFHRKHRKFRKELYRRWVKITCTTCGRRLTLPNIQKKRLANGVVDCYCGAMLLVRHGKARDFHKTLHSETDGRWPADGAGTSYVDI